MKREKSYVEIRIPFSSAAFCNAAAGGTSASGSGPPVHASGSRGPQHHAPVKVKSRSRPGTPEVPHAVSTQSLRGKPVKGVSKEKLQKSPTKKDKVQEVQESREDLTKNIHGGAFRKERTCPPGCDSAEAEKPVKKTDRSRSYSPGSTKSQEKLNTKSSKRALSTPPSKSERASYSRANPDDYANDGFTSSSVSASDFRAAEKTKKSETSKVSKARALSLSNQSIRTANSVSKDSGVNKSYKRHSEISPLSNQSIRTEASVSKDSALNKENKSKSKEPKRTSKPKRHSLSSKTKMAAMESDEETGSGSEPKLTKSDASLNIRSTSKKRKASNMPKRNDKHKLSNDSGSKKKPNYDGEADDEGDESVDKVHDDDDSDKGPLSNKNVQKFLLANPVFLNTFVEEHVDGATLHQWVQQKCCGNSQQAKAYKDAKTKHKAEKREAKKARKNGGTDAAEGSKENENDEGEQQEKDESDGGSGPEKLQALNFKLDQIPGCPAQGVPRAMTDEEIRRFKRMYGIDLRGGAASRRCNGGAQVCQARVEIPTCSQRPTGSVKCPAFKQYMDAHQQHCDPGPVCGTPGCTCAKCSKNKRC